MGYCSDECVVRYPFSQLMATLQPLLEQLVILQHFSGLLKSQFLFSQSQPLARYLLLFKLSQQLCFSLFREYVDQLVKYDKNFLIIGNVNAITYKKIFKLTGVKL